MNEPQISWLPDRRRLHMNHGPIDLIVEAWGQADEVRLAYGQAVARFRTILTELVAELPELRKPAIIDANAGNVLKHPLTRLGCASPPSPRRGEEALAAMAHSLFSPAGRRWPEGPDEGASQDHSFAGPTARRMAAAVGKFAANTFITPMAAVAGAVADETMRAMTAGRRLDKAYVNDGGDIALHLSEGAALTLAVAGTGHGFADRLTISHGAPVRGVATSGWRGRSFSLGIADAVTVLARDGATADAAATLIANAVDLPGHPAVARAPANTLQPDTDLGDRLVTTGVGALSAEDVELALSLGAAVAEDFRRRGLIEGAALFLAGEARVVGFALGQSPMRMADLPPPLTPPLKGEGDSERPRHFNPSKSADKAAKAPIPSPLRGGVRGGGANDFNVWNAESYFNA